VWQLIGVHPYALYPYIPIGSHTGYRYRLIPCREGLEVDEDWWGLDDPREIAADSVVGLNLVQEKIQYSDLERARSAQKRIDAPSNSESFKRNDDTAFVAYQAGILYAVEEKVGVKTASYLKERLPPTSKCGYITATQDS
jgi:hypothetical protein